MSTVSSYKCPNCGSGVAFNPDLQKITCSYCLGEFSKDIFENVINLGDKEQIFEETTVLFSCPACGAEVITDETTAASYCYYCHNPVIISGRLDGNFKPDKIIPFAFSRELAEEEFIKWTTKKWFVPKGFFSKDQIESMTGVYFPFWLVDGDITASINAKTRNLRIWRIGDIEYTETSTYDVFRSGNIVIDDITKNALKKENSQLVNSVLPYTSNKIIDFSPIYLTGFQAEKRNLEKDVFESEVINEIKGYSKKALLNTVSGFGAVTSSNLTVSSLDDVWEYTLFPVWTVTYKGRDGKTYFFTMNGQTGEVKGKTPIDYLKLILVSAGIGIITITLLMLLRFWLI